MKIAVISDIHGNSDALNTVLEDIKANGCDKIYALGDYAMAGPEPSTTVDWFMNNKEAYNITMIQGNTDLMIANYSEDLYNELKTKAPVMAEALRNDVKSLTSSQIDFLKNLPAQLETKEEGIKILLVHGSPRRNNEDIHPDLKLEEVESMLENVNADIVLCGHTHIPCGFQTTKKQTVVNVGSVGRPFTPEPKACYLIIHIQKDGKYLFEHKLVEYDKEHAATILRKRTFTGAEKLAETLLNPTVRHF